MGTSKSRSKPKQPLPVAAKKPAAPSKAAAGFAAIEPELAFIAPGEYAVINIDIPQAVAVVLGALPGLSPLRDAILSELPKFPIKTFDNLENHALGVWYAHLCALPPSGPDNPVRPLLEEATPLRADLLSDAEALARRDLLDAKAVAEIRAGQGNVDTANDLVALSALFSMNWEAIQGRTAATLEEVKRAGDLGPLLLAALGVREHGVATTQVDAADRRSRAFTAFVRAWNQVRRAVTYLRWNEGDADTLAPSLYKGRGGRGAQPADAETDARSGEGNAAGEGDGTPAAPGRTVTG